MFCELSGCSENSSRAHRYVYWMDRDIDEPFHRDLFAGADVDAW